MNPPIRRRLPASLRRLLTDIGPKEDWTDAGPASTTIDGVALPNTGEETFLEPATSSTGSAEDESQGRRKALCVFCQCKPSCYSCPRCNQPYCGLGCYRSPAHSACSEEFYQECVLQELKHMGRTDDKERRNMQEVLVGLKHKAENTEGGMEGLLKEAGVVSAEGGDGLEEKAQVMLLLSRLAELQQSGQDHRTEVQAIMRKLEEIGDVEEPSGDEGDDDDGDDDLAERLSQMDVDKLSEQELWELLSQKEKEKFISLTKSGALDTAVPIWTPWWEKHYECTLVEEVMPVEQGDQILEEQVCNQDKSSSTEPSTAFSDVPPLSKKISKLSSMCACPSPLICFSLVNAIFVYVFTMTLFNGDADSLMFDFCDMILALSEAFDSSRVFSSVLEALASAEALMLREGYLDKDDPLAPARALRAAAHVMSGRDPKDSTGYCLAALSQLRTVFSQAGSALSKEGEEGARRQRYFLARKKCEFFQAWVLENEAEIQRVAVEFWTEDKKRQSARKCLENAKTTVERQIKTVRRGHLIQEVSQ